MFSFLTGSSDSKDTAEGHSGSGRTSSSSNKFSNDKFFSDPRSSAEHSPHHSHNRGDRDRDRERERSSGRKRILFYHSHEPYYEFTNFSPDPIMYRGKQYPTSEHLFQSLKFLEHRPALAEHIRTFSSRPSKVFDETHRFNPEVRKDWLQVRVKMMDEVLWYKFTQNERLGKLLLSTGDAELVENSDRDAFWGVGPDGKGENQLGKALMRLRDRLREGKSREERDPAPKSSKYVL